MRPTVLLFDVDGTLVTTGGVGRRAIEQAFATLYGREDAFRAFRFDGMTDRAIIRGGLRALGVSDSEEEIDRIIPAYLHILEAEVATADLARYRVHPGILDALNEAANTDRVAVGLGTGNVKEGAEIKLRRVDIHQRFAFGGFGCDHEQRPELIRRGALRGADRLAVPLAECRVVVIGDTPKDVAAAQAIGAESLGVGTGSFTAEQLAAAGATHAFPSLATPGAVEALLGG